MKRCNERNYKYNLSDQQQSMLIEVTDMFMDEFNNVMYFVA